jgi:Transglutaminase-like superfamily
MLKRIIAAISLIGFISLGLILCDQSRDRIYEDIKVLQDNGNLRQAEELITSYLQSRRDLPAGTIRQLEYEIERGKRIRNDYNLKEEDLYNVLQQRLLNLQRDEFVQWQKEGRFDWLMIDGEKRFVNASASNLFFRYAALNQRRRNYNPISSMARFCLALARQLRQSAATTPDAVRLPRRYLVEQKVIIPGEKVPAGEKIYCWLPYPSVFELQGDVQFISSSHPPLWLAAAGSPIRSCYFEGLPAAAASTPTANGLTFMISYKYTSYACFQVIEADKVSRFSGQEPEYITYTRQEYPHEVFSDRLEQLCAAIIGTETNPYLKGKKIFDWIADSIKYSYAREYSTLHNISAYCLDKRYGDCGQEGILFITLCRIAGLPARWQSGFMTYPGDEGMHDWAEIYLRPYGWIPVDPYMGIFFTSVTADLTPQERREMREFYYGNMDNYRLVINKGHNLDLYPPKKYFRSETVDFQRGEVEWSGGNLYFSDWDWDIKFTDITSSSK